MDWTTAAALSQIIGAIAVVISLVYLATQIKLGSYALQATMRDSSFHALTEFNYYLLADPDLAWEFQQGMRDTGVLDEKQNARFVHTAYSFFKVFENVYLHYLEGTINPAAWEHNRHILHMFGAQPGAQKYIHARLPIFDPRFREILVNLRGAQVVPSKDLIEQFAHAGE
jgi:hypothetical protein